MAEYIEREALEKRLNERLKLLQKEHGYYDHYTDGYEEAVNEVEETTAADVAPVVHGEWIHNPKREYDYICSVCRGDAPEDRYRNNAILTPYCPHCGAVMDGGKK